MQQSRAIVITGDNNKKLWAKVKEEFAKFDDSEYQSRVDALVL
jgi:predicted oxidoreductase (fatty acid repression mutant protein)